MAIGTCRQAIEIATVPGPPPRAAGLGYMGMAPTRGGELDAALRYLTEGILLTRQFPYAQPLTTGLARLAWIRQARGDAPGARVGGSFRIQNRGRWAESGL